MKLLLIVRLCWLGVFMALPVAAMSCIWDRDTLADEAKGHGNIVEVMAGRFPRNPPLYYEMRLKRVADEIKATPENLGLYDDAGVACDRLGRGKEAMAWMEQKRALLDGAESSKTTKEHWYRYHANLGTFLAHEWVRNGADLDRMEMLERGAENIAKAIEINPDAHFGREKYQLEFLRWVLSKPDVLVKHKYSSDYLSHFIKLENDPDNAELREASKGLQGLITLGNAWESVDVYYALFKVHDKLQEGSISSLAMSRAVELVADGKKPILASGYTSETIRSAMDGGSRSAGEPKVAVPYHELRENADKWHQHRTNFMLEKLIAGKHPDTDDDFWKGYVEIPAVNLAETSILDKLDLKSRRGRENIRYVFSLVTAICILGSAVLFLRRKLKT